MPVLWVINVALSIQQQRNHTPHTQITSRDIIAYQTPWWMGSWVVYAHTCSYYDFTVTNVLHDKPGWSNY